MNTQLENVQIVAKFMGIKPCNCAHNCGMYKNDYGDIIMPPDYEGSWDWIMPVLQKIKVIVCETEFNYRFTRALLSFDIKAVYAAVIDFINWYKTQSK